MFHLQSGDDLKGSRRIHRPERAESEPLEDGQDRLAAGDSPHHEGVDPGACQLLLVVSQGVVQFAGQDDVVGFFRPGSVERLGAEEYYPAGPDDNQ